MIGGRSGGVMMMNTKHAASGMRLVNVAQRYGDGGGGGPRTGMVEIRQTSPHMGHRTITKCVSLPQVSPQGV